MADVNNKQNYDFGVFNRPAASSKRFEGEKKDGEGERRTREFNNEAFTNDWEEVEKKKRIVKPKENNENRFGAPREGDDGIPKRN